MLEDFYVSRARLGLQQVDGESLYISDSDEGVGFETSCLKPAGNPHAGLGLFSISERIGLIGGRLYIDSFPGKGCRLTLTVPLEPESPERMDNN
jgi:signal transduction histidine kinase